MSTANKTYICRTIERLYGILEGITIDCTLRDEEIAALSNWIETHSFLHDQEPFLGLRSLLLDILEDGIVDHDEREELLNWCSEAVAEKGCCEKFTPAIRRLHGLLGGIVCDKQITTEEVMGLQDWLFDHEHLKKWWPFWDLMPMVERILEDGVVDQDEEKELIKFFQDFAEQPLEHFTIHDEDYFFNENMRSVSPIFAPVSSVCEKNPTIVFKGNAFCFTGPAVTGKRKDLSAIVEQLGGIAKPRLTKLVNYLVIGGQSSPAWAYSTYGKKIEGAMQMQKRGFEITLIQEKDFIESVKNIGGENILPDPLAPPF